MKQYNGTHINQDILADKDLGSTEKILLSMVIHLSKKNGFCSMSNAGFGDRLGINERSVRRTLSSLKTKGYITIKLYNKRQERRMTVDKSSPKYVSSKPQMSSTQDKSGLNGGQERPTNNKYIINNNKYTQDKSGNSQSLPEIRTIGTWTGTKEEWDMLSPAVKRMHTA